MKIDQKIRTVLTRIIRRKVINGPLKSFSIHKRTVLQLSKTARINIQNHFYLNANDLKDNHRSSVLRMDDSSILNVGSFSCMYGADIIVFKNAILELGNNSFINSDCKIRCHKHIKIGDNCAISHDVTIMDGDGHELNGIKEDSDVIISNHVWIGTRVTILKGIHVGEGAVIAAGSVVTKNVPPKCLFGGVPGQIIKEGITWK